MCDKDYDPRYLGFFECLDQQCFFEAHEVLEPLWLSQRQDANGDFYKGLIQIAGALHHWQKNRPGPRAALFRLARANLMKYPGTHQDLDVRAVLALIDGWLRRLHTTAPAPSPPLATRWCNLLNVPKAARDV